MSNGFGRRQTITREGLRAIQGAEPSRESGGSGGGFSFSLPRPMLGLLVGVAVVGLLYGTHVAAMKGFGRALDRHWSENVGYPGVEDAYERSGSPDKLLEQVHNNCKSQSDFVGRNRPKTRADVMSADDMIIGTAVTYLTCLANEQPKRFCQPPHRTHLFAAVKDYYRLKAKIREEQVLMNSGPFAANRTMLTGPAREAVPTGAAMAQASDPRVIAALKALVSGGYVTGRDLVGAAGGWPSDLELFLRGVEPKQRGCP